MARVGMDVKAHPVLTSGHGLAASPSSGLGHSGMGHRALGSGARASPLSE